MTKIASNPHHHPHASDAKRDVPTAVVTVSDTRTLETDTGGALVVDFLEAAGHLVEGMPFHEYYLSPGPDSLARQSTISSPHFRVMGDVAVVSYIRLQQATDDAGVTTTRAMEETRIWQLQDGHWQHVHFHRSPAGSLTL